MPATDLHFLLYTKPSMEFVASKYLEAEGATVYMPQFMRRRYHARKHDMVATPLFPRYLFVKQEPHVPVRLLRSARGVSDMLKRETGPIVVHGDVIDNIRSREVNGFIEFAPVVAPEYAAGDQLRAVRFDDHSPLNGLLVKFVKMSSADRAIVSFDLFKSRTGEISLYNLERVARTIS